MLTQLTFPAAQIVAVAHMRRLQVENLGAARPRRATMLRSRELAGNSLLLALRQRLCRRIPSLVPSW